MIYLKLLKSIKYHVERSIEKQEKFFQDNKMISRIKK